MKRRNFIATSALGTAGLVTAKTSAPFHFLKTKVPHDYFVGTMVLAEDIYAKGITAELDRMQSLGGINTVMPFSHHHVARQYRPNFSPKTDATGNTITDVFVKTNPKYYKNKEWGTRNPNHTYADRDILDELGEACASRDMKVYARILEPYVITGAISGFEAFAEVDSYGEKGKTYVTIIRATWDIGIVS